MITVWSNSSNIISYHMGDFG